jgi:hypothetical protein
LATKKPRTPTPPRPVQAPKRRDSKRAAGPAGMSERNARWLLYGLAALGPIALAIVLAVVFLGGGSDKKGANGPPPKIDYAALPGLQTTKAPWQPEYASLPDRLKPLGLNALSAEVVDYHVHQHLDIFIDGKKTPVPANIGIDDGAFITELHTHDASGIMHVEAGKAFPYTLGQFFGVWGVRLSKNCVGGYCGPSQPVHFYLDGNPYRGDPNDLVLKDHEEIAIAVGKPPKEIPSTYNWKKAGV